MYLAWGVNRWPQVCVTCERVTPDARRRKGDVCSHYPLSFQTAVIVQGFDLNPTLCPGGGSKGENPRVLQRGPRSSQGHAPARSVCEIRSYLLSGGGSCQKHWAYGGKDPATMPTDDVALLSNNNSKTL